MRYNNNMEKLSNNSQALLLLVIRLFAVIFIAVSLGILGALANQYLGIGIFLVIFILGIVGSIKLFFKSFHFGT